MSGGRWDYQQFRIQNLTEEVASDHVMKEEFPELARKLLKLGDELATVIHKLDYYISGDTLIEDPEAFTKEALANLLHTLS